MNYGKVSQLSENWELGESDRHEKSDPFAPESNGRVHWPEGKAPDSTLYEVGLPANKYEPAVNKHQLLHANQVYAAANIHYRILFRTWRLPSLVTDSTRRHPGPEVRSALTPID